MNTAPVVGASRVRGDRRGRGGRGGRAGAQVPAVTLGAVDLDAVQVPGVQVAADGPRRYRGPGAVLS